MRLCLGTVQFGGDYGIRGGVRPSAEDAVRMLDFAVQNGVDAIDTAAAYGSAELVVGEFLARRTVPRDRLFVVSKFGMEVFRGLQPTKWGAALLKSLDESLTRLHVEYLDAYVCHEARASGDAAVAEALRALKESGKVHHVGFSVYETGEAMACVNSGACDFMQVPMSALDQRMSASGALAASAGRGVDVHARSAFVQGLLLMEESEVPDWLAGVREHVRAFGELCAAAGVSRRALALAFVRREKAVSHLVFGVDSMEQLRENVAAFREEVPADVLDEVARRFADVPPELVMPNKWRKK